jgi:hypothetical protein
MLQERPHFYDRHIAITINKILNRNGFGEGNDTNQGRRITGKDHLAHHNIFKYIYFHDSYQ